MTATDEIEIIIEYRIKPARRDAFLVQLRQNCAETLADRGCRQMRISEPVGGEPGTIFLTEHWRDQAAIDEHRQKPGHDEQHTRIDRMVLSKRVSKCTVLGG